MTQTLIQQHHPLFLLMNYDSFSSEANPENEANSSQTRVREDRLEEELKALEKSGIFT